MFIPCTTCLHIPLAHTCLNYYLLSPQYTINILFYCTFILTFTFTFSHLADAFIQSDLQLGVHKEINLEEANIQRKCQ